MALGNPVPLFIPAPPIFISRLIICRTFTSRKKNLYNIIQKRLFMKANSLTLAPPPNINQSTQFVCKEKWESGLSSPLFCRHIERRLELKSTSYPIIYELVCNLEGIHRN